MKLVITIDTEEDNWSQYSKNENPVENIEKILSLQALFDQFNIKPTYLVSYPVATNTKSINILKNILGLGKCEIGMHCHPWNTPPFNGKETIYEKNTMLCNLPEDLQYEKLNTLHNTIINNFDTNSISFRAGRWGFDLTTAKILNQLNYRIDTSITPYINWKKYYGPDFSSFGPKNFKFDSIKSSQNSKIGNLQELPATIGFLQSNFDLSQKIFKSIEAKAPSKLHLIGILDRLKLLNKIWLSPEMFNSNMMIKLTKRLQRNNYKYINMFFHSTSLKNGLSPFVRTAHEEKIFFQRIRDFLMFVSQNNIESMTLKEVSAIE